MKIGLGTNVNTAGKKGAGKPEEPGSGGAKHCQKSCGSEWATDQKKQVITTNHWAKNEATNLTETLENPKKRVLCRYVEK